MDYAAGINLLCIISINFIPDSTWVVIGEPFSTRPAISSCPCLLFIPQLLASGLSLPRLPCLFSQRGGILVVFAFFYLVLDSLFYAGVPEPLQGGVD